jgi:eukaryotic-like serine/threonine-protein kinase
MKCPECQFDNPDATNFCGKCGVSLTADARMADSLTKTLAIPLPVIAKDKLISGKYRILEEIGHGGMGIVYKAEDLQLQRCVALKFLPTHLMGSPELRERFLIEARAAAALSHPNICVIHEVGESEERPYIAMEFVDGQTLKDRLRGGALAASEALSIAGQVAAGLGEAHNKGIIHRDVKSANIMVTPKGLAKVMDFGLAKLHGGSSLTKSRTTLGTVAYMSPEQAGGGDLDARTDVWSLGVVLYEMLTAELPFQGDHDQTVIHAILHREPKSPSKIRPGLPPGLDNLVLKALAKRAAERYPSMEELREDLEAIAGGIRPVRAGHRILRRIRSVGPAWTLCAALAVLVVLFGLDVGGLRSRIFGRGGQAEPAVKLAVLPFRNLTGDPSQDYLSDGVTEELTALLGRLNPQRLGVFGRTSVLRYKKGDTPIDQIGRELGVSHVLEGSMQREGSRVRINAELVRVSDGTQVWTGTYEPELSGILGAQGQVAQGAAKALAVRLLPAEEARQAVTRTVNPEAYELCLRGAALWKTMKNDELAAAHLFFEQALKSDPSYAPAYAGLGWVWMARQQMGFVRVAEGVPRAKEAALKAVHLDGNSAAAHEALATVLTWGEWDWTGAEAEWTRALELDPNNDNAQAYYAHYLAHRGRASEGVRHSDLAVKLDPMNALNHALRGMVLIYLRRFDDAIAAARTAISLRADLSISYVCMQRAYMAKGMRDELLADQRLRISRDPERVAAFNKGLAEGGYEGAQRAIADVLAARFERTQDPSSVSLWGIALRYLDAGDNERALSWLQKAYDYHDSDLPYTNAPPWDRLRDDPRYQALLRRIGLAIYE